MKIYNNIKKSVLDEGGELRVPIKSWCMNPEDGAIAQARNLANLPFLFKHVALMPDTHQGYGMPIGGVIALENVVIPNAVGVDIGCGMLVVQTNVNDIPREILEKIVEVIRRKIPTGYNHNKEQCDISKLPVIDYGINDPLIIFKEYEKARYQLGTLGGGNHFIEIQQGSDGFIWFMIHSGSRNLGYTVAKHYNKLAQELCTRWHSNVPDFKGDDGLAFFPVIEELGERYLYEMNYCLEFAKANREQMAWKIKDIISNCMLKYDGKKVGYDMEVNIHHNYASLENHFGKNVWVHRKGATSAKKGELGIIPGSQGTSSFIVEGKGNKESFMSCSHGAGRTMGRKHAKKILSLEDEQTLLNKKGVLHTLNKDNLDEASSAYKPIETVMKEQEDLVKILVKLEPLAVVKG